ncbi:hypothetical protein M378DRAFT_867800 [Amanita muscaria Koide BX008]|uniref:Uncharacterized protein n=1 Tax=Amanita muscaria (strain Koide BX008) TaxID=946122 RepID=A0A0C2T3S8_AMAMK|nr:hypothetical protein M378DRAFT_867800 [Amanita muscaria Koide BX008]
MFWSTLDINIDACLEEELPYHDSIFELVQLALKRSNGYPLSLSIAMHWVFEGDTAATIRMRTKDILEMLVAHSMSWRDLHLVLHHSCYPTLYRAKDQLPVLRSIKAPLTTFKFTILQQIRWDSINFQDIFTNATQLTRVHFFAVKIYWSINWSPMTVIHLVSVTSLDEVIPTLRQPFSSPSPLTILKDVILPNSDASISTPHTQT